MKCIKKLLLLKNNRKEDQQQIIQDIENFKIKFSEIDGRFQILEQGQVNNKQNIDYCINELHLANEKIIKAKEANNEAIIQQSRHVDSQIKSLVDDIIELKNFTNDHENRIRQHHTEIKGIQSNIQMISSQIEKLMLDWQDLNNNKLDKEAHVESAKSIWESVRELEIKVNDHYNHTMTLENYLEKYAPMHTQNQISEVMHSWLDKKYKKKLVLFEKNKFEELHQIILEDEGNPYLKQHMDKMVDKIITEIKANTASNRKKSRYSKNSSAIKSKNRSIVSKDVSESKDSIYWEQNPEFNKKQNYNNSHVKSVSHAPDAEKVLDSNEYIMQNNMSDNNPDDIDLDDSITLTERLDEVKDNIYKEVRH